ncbi:MAG: hypothetical protein ACXWC4_18700 [Telluria sp.]
MKERVCDTVRGGNVSGFMGLPCQYRAALHDRAGGFSRRMGAMLRDRNSRCNVESSIPQRHIAARYDAALGNAGWLKPARIVDQMRGGRIALEKKCTRLFLEGPSRARAYCLAVGRMCDVGLNFACRTILQWTSLAASVKWITI